MTWLGGKIFVELNFSRSTHCNSWPSLPSITPVHEVTKKKYKIVILFFSITLLVVHCLYLLMETPSSSKISLLSASDRFSLFSSLPPGNSHQPGQLWESSLFPNKNLPSESLRIPTATWIFLILCSIFRINFYILMW